MSDLRAVLGLLIAELAKALVRLAVRVSGQPTQLPTQDDYNRFEAWDARWRR